DGARRACHRHLIVRGRRGGTALRRFRTFRFRAREGLRGAVRIHPAQDSRHPTWLTQERAMSEQARLQRRHSDDLIVGLVSVSDRASSGQYQDAGIPALQSWLETALVQTPQCVTRLVPDERETVDRTLVVPVDDLGCDLVLTTGCSRPARLAITPGATVDC